MGGKSKSVTVGYRYFMGLHIGVGRGPVDSLVEIQCGGRKAWPLPRQEFVGRVQKADGSWSDVYREIESEPPVTSSRQIRIAAGDLFGGDSAEGGLDGTLDVMMGEPTQGVNPRLASMLGGLVPAFRGMFTMFYDGLICSLNPYPKAWEFRVRRTTKGWFKDKPWYPEKARIVLEGDIHAMNPAHIIYEAATNPLWGRGLDPSSINEPSFIAAANTLAEECFGLCFKWMRQEEIGVFIGQVLDHIGGALYPDRQTGKLTLRLIRQDYRPEDLPVFSFSSGLLRIEEDEGTSSSNLRSEISVTYTDVLANEPRTVRVQNIAGLQAMRSVSSETVEYVGVPTASLALRLAQRDLRARGLPLRRFKITLDRRGEWIEPGAPFRVSAPTLGIGDIVLRAGMCEDDTDTSSITVTAIEDVFGLPASSFVEPQPPTPPPANQTPIPPVNYKLQEVSYADLSYALREADLNTVKSDSAYVVGLAHKPNNFAINFKMHSAPYGQSYARAAIGDFSPGGLVASIHPRDRTISVFAGKDTRLLSEGDALSIGDEVVRVDAITVISDTELLLQVGRGCVDTIPAHHAHGTPAFSYRQYASVDDTEYLEGERVKAKFATRSGGRELPLEESPETDLQTTARHFRPYLPGDVRVNGKAFYEEHKIEGAVTLTWASRDRLSQMDRLIDHSSSSIGPEPGVTITVRIEKPAGDLIREVTGITGETYTYALTEIEDDEALGDIVIALTAVRSGTQSHQTYRIPVVLLPSGVSGFGFTFGENFGG